MDYLYNIKKENNNLLDPFIYYLNNNILFENKDFRQKLTKQDIGSFSIDFEKLKIQLTKNRKRILQIIFVIKLYSLIDKDKGITSYFKNCEKILQKINLLTINVLPEEISVIKQNLEESLEEIEIKVLDSVENPPKFIDKNILKNFEEQINNIIEEENVWRIEQNLKVNKAKYKLVPKVKNFSFINFLFDLSNSLNDDKTIFKLYNLENYKKEQINKSIIEIKNNLRSIKTKEDLIFYQTKINNLIKPNNNLYIKKQKELMNILSEKLKESINFVNNRFEKNKNVYLSNEDITLTNKILNQNTSFIDNEFVSMKNIEKIYNKQSTINLSSIDFLNDFMDEEYYFEHANSELNFDIIIDYIIQNSFNSQFIEMFNFVKNKMKDCNCYLDHYSGLNSILSRKNGLMNIDHYVFTELTKYYFANVVKVNQKYMTSKSSYLPVNRFKVQIEGMNSFITRYKKLRTMYEPHKYHIVQDKYFGHLKRVKYDLCYNKRIKQTYKKLGSIEKKEVENINPQNNFSTRKGEILKMLRRQNNNYLF